LALIEQCLSGNPGASLDRYRLPSRPIAAEQQAALLTIDTACHGLGFSAGAIECFTGACALISLFHINRLSIYGAASVAAANRFRLLSCAAD
jgi:hypothetical protein